MNPRALLTRVVASPIDAHKEKQPHHIYEVSVPSARFKAEVVSGTEMEE